MFNLLGFHLLEQALQVELLNSRMRNIGLEPVIGPQSLEVLLQDESHQELLADIRFVFLASFVGTAIAK
jgi:hypothetical protein